eukprot:9055418-Lingulodinium_polyedra.AAC.1
MAEGTPATSAAQQQRGNTINKSSNCLPPKEAFFCCFSSFLAAPSGSPGASGAANGPNQTVAPEYQP